MDKQTEIENKNWNAWKPKAPGANFTNRFSQMY